MKKSVTYLLSIVLLVLLCACGNSSTTPEESSTTKNKVDASVENSDAQKTEEVVDDDDDDDDVEAIEKSEESKFVPSEDLVVVINYNYDNDKYVVVENVSDRAILDYKIAMLEFDKNGFTVSSDGYHSGKVEAANMLPGDKDVSSFYGADGKYLVATVSEIKYSDGEVWSAQMLSSWEEDVLKSFSVDDAKSISDTLIENAAKAEKNEYASVTHVEMKHSNQFSEQGDIWFTTENIGEKDITNISHLILEYNENGYAVSVSPYDTYALNARFLGGACSIVSGGNHTYGDNLFFVGSCTQFKTIITSITFADGEEWENPYLYEWLYVNKDIYTE